MTEVKYVFVTGGVTSSLGKGIIAASLAKLLQARGFTVTIQKLEMHRYLITLDSIPLPKNDEELATILGFDCKGIEQGDTYYVLQR